MYKNETKENIKSLVDGIKAIDMEMVKIKTAIHTLDKLGFNVENEYKQLENVGIELYKQKQMFMEIYDRIKTI
jgi:predicted transcriptional regulator